MNLAAYLPALCSSIDWSLPWRNNVPRFQKCAEVAEQLVRDHGPQAVQQAVDQIQAAINDNASDDEVTYLDKILRIIEAKLER